MMKNFIVLIVLMFTAIVAPAKPRCDQEVAKHVYKPERLVVVKPCVEVFGTIVDATKGKRKDGVRHEPDGDTHGWLKLDKNQDDALLLNDGNRKSEKGNLVFEIVCRFTVTQEDAKAACLGYHSTVVLPPVGSHVRIVAPLVREKNHAKWIELHPVTLIEVVR